MCKDAKYEYPNLNESYSWTYELAIFWRWFWIPHRKCIGGSPNNFSPTLFFRDFFDVVTQISTGFLSVTRRTFEKKLTSDEIGRKILR